MLKNIVSALKNRPKFVCSYSFVKATVTAFVISTYLFDLTFTFKYNICHWQILIEQKH